MINAGILFFYLAFMLSGTAECPLAKGGLRTFNVNNVQQFNRALTNVKPGDHIIFEDGNYKDLVFHFKTNGGKEMPITFRADTPGKVVFSGKTQIFIDGNWLVVSGFTFENIADVPNISTPYNVLIGSIITFDENANHSRLTECAFINPGNKVSSYLHMEPGGQHNRVDRCYFSGQQDIGPSIYIEVDSVKPNYAVMEECFIGNRREGSGNRWETLRIGHSLQQYFVSQTTVRGNYFTHCDGENEMVSNKSTGNKYLHNTFIDNKGELTLRHGDEAWIEGNYFDDRSGVGAPGIRIIGSRHVIINNYLKRLRFAFNVYNGEKDPEPRGYTQVNDVVIAFNTIENCEEAFRLGTTNRPLAPKNLRIFYNLVQSTGDTILHYSNKSTDVTYKGNIMYGGEVGISDEGISEKKPALVSDTLARLVADYRKLVYKGDRKVIPGMITDINGTPKPGSCNVGAIETAGGNPVYPLSPKDVGPSWMRTAK